MKVTGPGTVQSAARVATKKQKSSATSFLDALNQKEHVASADEVHSSAALDPAENPYLFLQEADDDNYKQEMIDYGQSLLDRLDDIRLSLLTGAIKLDDLERLALQMERLKQRPNIDNRLRDIINEIELRAAVELAKLSQ